MRLRINPDDEDEVYFYSVAWAVTLDGGETIETDLPRPGGDNHDGWIDPEMPNRHLVANDGGLSVSLDRGRTWERHTLPIAQVYHVFADTRVPYYVYGNRQDGPSFMAPSNTRTGGFFGGGLSASDWRNFGGCESGFGIPDTITNNAAWSGCYDGGLERTNLTTFHSRNVEVWPESAIGWPPKEIKERFHWTFPIHISPHDHERVYIGSQRVHVTTDAGQSYQVLSPDLTRDMESHQESSGGITTDNLQTFDGAVLYAIAESPLEEGVVWAGSNDGLVHVTRDGGESWTDVTGNVPGIPRWATISNIEPSRHDPATAYMAVDDHMQGNYEPYIYKTTDYGRSWELISEDIPTSVFSNVHMVEEDPVREGMLFAGTENSVFFSLDDGESWNPLQTNLPHAPAYWLQVQTHFHDLLLATYGRGIWILDDMTPLRQLDGDVLSSGVHLFELRDAYRFARVESRAGAGYDLRASNPPYGAAVNYWLGDGDDVEEVRIEILDSSNEVIRTLEGTTRGGINRVWWDLRHEGLDQPRFRVDPPGREWVNTVPEDGREIVTWSSGFDEGPRVVPGTYTVRLSVDGRERTTTVEVLKDPHTEGTLADIRAQVDLQLQMREEHNRVVAGIHQLEWIRRQRQDAARSLENQPGAASLAEQARAMAERARQVEHRFVDTHLTGGREDTFRNPNRLYGRYLELESELDAIADFPPTDPQQEVHEVLRQRLEDAEQELRSFLRTELQEFNETLRDRGISPVVSDDP